jgi:hypothetical protein
MEAYPMKLTEHLIQAHSDKDPDAGAGPAERAASAVAISVSDSVRSGVRRKPASDEMPTNPRTDFAWATSMRGKVQFVWPSD